MVEAGNGEHANHVQRRRHCHRSPTPPDPENTQTSSVHGDERHTAQPIDIKRLSLFKGLSIGPRSKPANNGTLEAR
jgi:hypothetical protein